MRDQVSRLAFVAIAIGLPRGPRLVAVACAAAGSLAFLGLTSSITRAQSQTTFRGGIDLVQLDVVVLDRYRRPVTGLNATDFTILEDGNPREIVAFAPVTLPVRTAGATPREALMNEIAPDVVGNDRPDEGRLVVILMDRSIWAGAQTVTARQIAHAAIDALGPSDLAAVVTSSGFSDEGAAQNFTADKARLRAAVDAPRMGLVNPPEMGPGGLSWSQPDLVTTGDCPCGVCVMDTIARVADALRAERTRQKVLLFVGSDIVIQLDPREMSECQNAAAVARERALRALDIANVTVHSLDTTGLDTLQKRAEFGPPRSRSAELARQANLGVLPDYTGGRAVFNTNGPESAVPAIFDESRSYYVLGFARSLGKSSELRRNIRVRVSRDDVTVRARTSYYAADSTDAAPAEGPALDPLVEAVRALAPAVGLPLRLALTPSFTSDGNTEVSVMLGVGQAAAAGGSGEGAMRAVRAARQLETLVAVFDPEARQLGSERQTLEIPAALAEVDPVESSSKLALAPGRYEIRVAVRDVATGRSGSVFGYVEVPDPARQPLSLSGVTLEVLRVGATSDPPTPGAPTLRRTFSQQDRVAAHISVHRRSLSPVTASVTVVGVGSGVTWGTRLEESAFSAAGVADFRTALPLERLGPGRHLLSIDVSAGGSSVRRELPFEVR